MYLSLRERPDAPSVPDATRRRPVGRTVVLLGCVSLLTDVSSESVAAILPLYLSVVVGLSPAAYGVVEGLYQGVSALVRLGAGWVSDRTGRPKWVAASGYGVSAVSRVLLPLVSGLGAVSAVVTADRVGKGIRTSPRDAMIAADADPEHLGRAFGVHRALDAVGAFLGPVLAFVVLWLVPGGYRSVMVLSIAFAVAGLALLVLFVPAGAGAVPVPAGPAPPRVRWRDLRSPELLRVSVVAGALGLLTVGDGFVYLVLLESGGFAAHWFPVLYVGTSAAYLLLALPVGRLADRCGRARVLVVGHLALAAAYAGATLLATRSVAVGTVATVLLLGLFYAATDGVLAAVAGQAVPVRARASGIALAQTVVAVARLLSAVGFGVLWLVVGPTVALLGVAAGLVLLVPAALRLLAPASR
ncbi:MFS transporter [Nocardioides lianchengensis]|uniref:Na+/melibiose symporter n=1 Tax=Nocardioides lianchengensis TaxID=1045774 RepID=A0A1G6VRL9_9ACTN|nr:MFS transporter [Nocardioides lianchengensis]NYG11267.1 MFS family permease [Nocardioides lianchengensis]SDD56063.1 Na+/melibiose symporter [Nocardioides lianchengensis]